MVLEREVRIITPFTGVISLQLPIYKAIMCRSMFLIATSVLDREILTSYTRS